ncbi:MAG: glycosyltransferase [Clostridia bacterium]|nr:glycosyltransferase [Clostridia bacterium]
MSAMQNNPKISIVVPVYNAEKFLDRCMKSIYDQTFSDYEIILVNDGSKDKSLEICRAYEEKDARITVIDKPNEGAGSARNAGMLAAKGDYLAFPDVDDWFEANMYEELYALATSGDYDVVFSGANYYKPGKGGELTYSNTVNCAAVSYLTKEECRANVMTFFPTSTIFDVPWNKLYRRSVATENGVRFSDTRRCQDAMFNIDFYNFISSAASVNKAYYNYIENTTATTNRKFPKNYIDINVAYFGKLIDILSSWGMYEGDIKRHFDTSFALAIYETMGMFENPVWGLDKAGQRKYVRDILNRNDVQNRLNGADIREDALPEYKILVDRDEKAFFAAHKKEKRRERLRQNKLLVKIYHLLKPSH